MLPIKKAVDERPRPGRFLLTGSADLTTLPQVADSLAGRSETIAMLPLAQAEIRGTSPTFIAQLFDAKLEVSRTAPLRDSLSELVVTGGYPEAVARPVERRRQAWGRAYLASVLGRDLRDIATIEKLTELPKLVRLIAAQSSQLVNYSELATAIGVNYKTIQRYVGLLEQVFVVRRLDAWHTNAIKRIIKTPKLHFLDSGLLATMRGMTVARLRSERAFLGPLLETFVVAEVGRLMAAADQVLTPYHFRDQDGHEVDLVLERDDGMVVGIEVKASATVTPADFAGLRKLAGACGSKFACGVVIHDGDAIVPFGARQFAVPLSCLWEGPAQAGRRRRASRGK